MSQNGQKLQQMLQYFQSVSVHFGTLWIKGLKIRARFIRFMIFEVFHEGTQRHTGQSIEEWTK